MREAGSRKGLFSKVLRVEYEFRVHGRRRERGFQVERPELAEAWRLPRKFWWLPTFSLVLCPLL